MNAKMLSKCILFILLLSLSACADEATTGTLTEDDFNDSLCQTIGGDREVRRYYTYGDDQEGYVSVDCETNIYVIEGGLDRRSSLDSLQQALFFSVLTSKTPAVVIYDTDGSVGRYEHRIQAASEKVGVLFIQLRFDDTMDSEWLASIFGE